VNGPNRTLLDLFLELETLDRIPRSGYLLRGIADCESIAEHSFHLAAIVWLLAGREPALDRARALELALVHDLAELRIGDLPRTAVDYFAPGAKHAAERRAVDDILAPAEPRARRLYAEYESEASPEARFVRACDRLQLLLKASVYERWGHGGLGEFWENPANLPPREFASVAQLFDELRARRADAPRDAAGAPRADAPRDPPGTPRADARERSVTR
jgi:putative hydrolase of HD superfamily